MGEPVAIDDVPVAEWGGREQAWIVCIPRPALDPLRCGASPVTRNSEQSLFCVVHAVGFSHDDFLSLDEQPDPRELR